MFSGPADSPRAAICARVESPKHCGEAGWLHVLRDDGPAWPTWRRTINVAIKSMSTGTEVDFAKLADEFQQAARPEDVAALAECLGLSAEGLGRLRVGWSKRNSAWSFPMVDVDGNVLGIRLRLPDGRKLAVPGGHEGLFIATDLDLAERVLICEGPTDTAALLDLGFPAIGRPSCTGGAKLLVDLVEQRKPREVVIVADGDLPDQRGAQSLAVVLVAYAAAVRIITPPVGIKDARAWKLAGATAVDVQAAIDAAAVRQLNVAVTRRKAGRHG
jgi:hypothetical protein